MSRSVAISQSLQRATLGSASLVWAAVTTILMLALLVPAAVRADDYRIFPGDSIAVYVNGELGLGGPQVVTAGGLVPVPFVGHLPVNGMTASEAQEVIRAALVDEELYTDADVLVVVTDSQPIYVSGLVENPGAYPLRGAMTVAKALALAGGARTLADEGGSPAAIFQYFNAVASIEEDRRAMLRASLALQRLDAQLAREPQAPDFEVPDSLDLSGEVISGAIEEERERFELLEGEAREARTMLEKNIQLVQTEIKTVIDRRAELEALVAVLDEDVAKARELVQRGLGKSSSVVAAQRTLSLARVDMLEMDRSLTLAQQRLAAEEAELRGLASTRTLALSAERTTQADQLASAAARLSARRQQVAMSPGLFSMTATEDAVSLLQYIIERQIDGVPERQSVGESFVMLPGDLLIVSAAQVAN